MRKMPPVGCVDCQHESYACENLPISADMSFTPLLLLHSSTSSVGRRTYPSLHLVALTHFGCLVSQALSPTTSLTLLLCQIAIQSLYSLTSIQAVLLLIEHDHDLPLEDIAALQATTYARDVFVRLHLLELSAEEDCRTRAPAWGA